MILHPIQKKLLEISGNIDLKKMSLREIAHLVDEEHPQKISHHLTQLEKKGLIKIDRRSGKIKILEEQKTKNHNLITIPILGTANCGQANISANENLEGYLKISKKFMNKKKDLFGIKAHGLSMNKANIKGFNIEDGDHVIIDGGNKNPGNGDYVLSIIDEMANIKRFYMDKSKKQIALISESTENLPPIYIHPDDRYMINGVVEYVVKKLKKISFK